MLENNLEIDKTKNYIKTNKGLIGPIEAVEIIKFVEQGMVQDNDEIFLPSKNAWEKLCNIHDLYSLKPKHTLEFEFPDLVEIENKIIDKTLDKHESGYQKYEKIARYKRIQISLPVKYRKKGANLEEERVFEKALSVDLSISGMSFEVYGSVFIPETLLEIEIDFTNLKEPFISIVKVERVTKGFKDQYIIGVRFIEMKLELKRMLVSFIRKEIIKEALIGKNFNSNKY